MTAGYRRTVTSTRLSEAVTTPVYTSASQSFVGHTLKSQYYPVPIRPNQLAHRVLQFAAVRCERTKNCSVSRLQNRATRPHRLRPPPQIIDGRKTSHGIGPTSWPSSATKQTRTAAIRRPILIVAVVRAVVRSIRSLSAAKLLHIPKHKTVAYLATIDRFYVAAPCRPIFGTSCLYLLEPSTTSPVLRLF